MEVEVGDFLMVLASVPKGLSFFELEAWHI